MTTLLSTLKKFEQKFDNNPSLLAEMMDTEPERKSLDDFLVMVLEKETQADVTILNSLDISSDNDCWVGSFNFVLELTKASHTDTDCENETAYLYWRVDYNFYVNDLWESSMSIYSSKDYEKITQNFINALNSDKKEKVVAGFLIGNDFVDYPTRTM